jgi:hypothetical protein
LKKLDFSVRAKKVGQMWAELSKTERRKLVKEASTTVLAVKMDDKAKKRRRRPSITAYNRFVRKTISRYSSCAPSERMKLVAQAWRERCALTKPQ